jgi:hypothetical protein
MKLGNRYCGPDRKGPRGRFQTRLVAHVTAASSCCVVGRSRREVTPIAMLTPAMIAAISTPSLVAEIAAT